MNAAHALQAAPAVRPLAPVEVVALDGLRHDAEGPTRGYAHIGFEDYPPQAPGHLDFGPLQLFADGQLQPGEGLPMHPHAGVENLLIVLRGRMRHRDHLGNDFVAGPGDACLMSFGAGGEHSEFVEGDEEVHALVIWLRSNQPEAPYRVHRRHIASEARRDRWVPLARPSTHLPIDEVQPHLPLAADAEVLAARLSPGATLEHAVEPGRRAYLIAIDGGVEINGQGVGPGERVFVPEHGLVEVFARGGDGEFDLILVDMATPTA